LKSLLTEDFDIVRMVRTAAHWLPRPRNCIDVIVADISMPHLNGIDAIAQRKSNASVKVILLTMHQDPPMRGARSRPAPSVCGQTLRPAEIVMAIHAALKARHS
jgi:DNA-binding NarL/FixJ family response regulator